MHLQPAWAHFVDEAVLADPWLAAMLESSAMLASQSTQQDFSKNLATQSSGTARSRFFGAIGAEDLRGEALRPLAYRVALPIGWGMGKGDTDWKAIAARPWILAPRRVAARGAGGGVTAMRMLFAAPGYFAGTITSRSLPDSAPQASPARPSICRTSAPRRSEAKLSNFSVAGSNLTIALIDQSVSQTLS